MLKPRLDTNYVFALSHSTVIAFWAAFSRPPGSKSLLLILLTISCLLLRVLSWYRSPGGPILGIFWASSSRLAKKREHNSNERKTDEISEYLIESTREYEDTRLREYGITRIRDYGITRIRDYEITRIRHYETAVSPHFDHALVLWPHCGTTS